MISFFALPENGDYSVENIFGSLGDNIVKVLGESQVGLNLGDGFWVGSLDEVNSASGYWAVLNSDQTLEVQGLPTAPVLYGLHEGNNLISYDHAIGQDIEGAFPSTDNIDAVYGEGVMAANIDGEFFGALSTIDPGHGYWLVANTAFTFEYNNPGDGSSLAMADNPPKETAFDKNIVSSTNQYFYFIEEATIKGQKLNPEDVVIAECNHVVVGARKYQSGMVDLAIRGYDESLPNTEGYCKNGDLPVIKVYRDGGGEPIVMKNITVNSGSRNFVSSIAGGHAMVTMSDSYALPSQVALHDAYPNPFNPSTTIKYDLPEGNRLVNLSIYDVRGRLVTELVNDYQVGSHDSYQVIWNADMQSSGVYFVRLIAGDVVQNQKIMLIK